MLDIRFRSVAMIIALCFRNCQQSLPLNCEKALRLRTEIYTDLLRHYLRIARRIALDHGIPSLRKYGL